MTIAVQLLAMPVFQAPSTIQTALVVRPGNVASQRPSFTTTNRSESLFKCFWDNPVRVLVPLLESNHQEFTTGQGRATGFQGCRWPENMKAPRESPPEPKPRAGA